MQQMNKWIKVSLLTYLMLINSLMAATLDWNSEGGWTAGALSKTYTNVDGSGVNIDVTVTGDTARLSNSTPNDVTDALDLSAQFNTKTEEINVTVSFTTPIKLKNLRWRDIDFASGDFDDRVIVSAKDTSGVTVYPNNIRLGSQVIENIPLGQGNYESDNTGLLGDTQMEGYITVDFTDVAITEISFSYTNGPDAPADPNGQHILFQNFKFYPQPIVTMTKDSNVTGNILPGDTVGYTIVVQNDVTALGDASNVTVRDPLPNGITYVAQSTVATGSIIVNTVTAIDDFSSGTFTGGSGWVQAEWVRAGSRVITGGEARMQDDGTYIYRSVDLSSVSSAKVSFDIREVDFLEAADLVTVEICSDTTFTNCQTLFRENNDFSNQSIIDEPISTDKLTATSTFRLILADYLNSAEYVYIDNIIINGYVINNNITKDNNTNANLLDGVPENLVLGGDNFVLAPGETLTVTLQVRANADLIAGTITNIAYASSTELSPEEVNATVTNTTVPVTISYAYPVDVGGMIELDFSTATETSNVGFNIYAVNGRQWVKLNEELIPGALDSLIPLDYHTSLIIPDNMIIRKIGIAGVDVNGVEDRHGPFRVGQESGSQTEIVPIEWSNVRQAYRADKEARKSERRAKKATKGLFREDIVNLKIKEDAIYHIGHDDLLAQEINLEGMYAHSIAISFKGEGVVRHIANLDRRKKWTTESYIEFEGKKPQGSDALYLSASNYRLSLNRKLVLASKSIEPMTRKELVFENNTQYSWTQPGNDPFYDALFYTRGAGSPGTLTRTLTVPELPQGEMELTLYVSGFSNLLHNLKVTLNGTEVASVQTRGYAEIPIKIAVNAGMLSEGDNTLTITAIGTDNNIDVFTYDKTVLSYDDEANVALTPEIAFSNHLPEREIRVRRTTNYLILAHPMFIGEALERYVSQKEGEGWNIQVVSVEDIYDAYGYGMETPQALKTYLDEARKKRVTHVQLVGAASYDYKDYLGLGSISFIPSLYAPTGDIVRYTPCDGCLVEDDMGLPELAIGRWPVRTVEELEVMINKTLTWSNSGQSNAHTALMIADQKEVSANFSEQMESLAQQFETNENWNSVTRVYFDEKLIESGNNVTTAIEASRTEIMNTLNNGVSIVSYSGHSAPTLWSYKRLLTYKDAANIYNAGQTALALPLACYTNYADSPSVNTMAHQFLAESENGFVAIYGAATLSNFKQNGISAQKMTEHLLNGETIGEAILNSKRELGVQYMDVIRNSNLLGDVTLEIK